MKSDVRKEILVSGMKTDASYVFRVLFVQSGIKSSFSVLFKKSQYLAHGAQVTMGVTMGVCIIPY